MHNSSLNHPKRSIFLSYFFEGRKFYNGKFKGFSINKLFFCGKLLLTSIFDRYVYRHYDYFICGSDVILSLTLASKLASSGKVVLLAPTSLISHSNPVRALVDLRQSICTKTILRLLSNELKLDDWPSEYNELIGSLVKKIKNINCDINFGSVEILSSDSFYIPPDDGSMIHGVRQVVPGRMRVFEGSAIWGFIRESLPSVSIGRGSIYDTIISIENTISTSRSIKIDSKGLYKGVNYYLGDAATNTELFQYLGEEERLSDIISAINFNV